MPKYNYQNLNPEEFENLASDVMTRIIGVPLFRFAAGQDDGIDLTESVEHRTIIVQCKRYKNVSDLMSALKKEAKRIRQTDTPPQSYYVFTSVELSANSKKNILALFDGLMSDERNIWDAIAIEGFFQKLENMDLVAIHKKLFEAFPEGYLSSYKDSFQEYVDTWTPLIEISETYHYRNNYLECLGREAELKCLKQFLACDGHLRWMGVVGPGGMGKSKLMYSFIQQVSKDPLWKAIWIPFCDIYEVTNKDYSRWSYHKNLMIIIDYAGKEAESIGRWIQRMERRLQVEDPNGKKVRIVLIEREDITFHASMVPVDPVWYKRLQGYGDQKQYINQLLYRVNSDHPFLQVLGLQKEYNNILVRQYLEKKKVNLEDDEIKNILLKAQRVDYEYDRPRPLFILLTIDAYLEKKDTSFQRYHNVMEYVLSRQERHWLETICKNDEQLLKALKQMLVFATACASWDSDHAVDEPFASASQYLQSLGKKELKDIILSVNKQIIKKSEDNKKAFLSTTDYHLFLNPLEPDLIGEYFVLFELKNICGKDNLTQAIQTLWQKENEFYEFLYRCCETYYNENDFSYFFGDGFGLLRPENNGKDRFYLYARLLSYLAKRNDNRIQLMFLNDNLARISKENPDDKRIALEYAECLFNEETDISLVKLRELYLLLKETVFSIKYFDYMASLAGTFTEDEWKQFAQDIEPFITADQEEESYLHSYAEAVRSQITVCEDNQKQTIIRTVYDYQEAYAQSADRANLYLAIFRDAYTYGNEQTKEVVGKLLKKLAGHKIFQTASDKTLCSELLSISKNAASSFSGLIKFFGIKRKQKPEAVLNEPKADMFPSMPPNFSPQILQNFSNEMGLGISSETVYCSYARNDSNLVEKYIRTLIGNDNRVLNTQYDIFPQSNWDEDIADKIQQSRVFICFISKASIESKMSRNEIAYAIRLRKRIIPVYLEEVTMPDGLELQLSRYRSIKAYEYYDNDIENHESTLALSFMENVSRDEGGAAYDSSNHKHIDGRLFIKDKNGNIQKVQVHASGFGCVIGRSGQADISVPDTAISRRHFMIRKEGQGFYIEDMQSVNGTRLNGKTITPGEIVALPDGSVISAGNTIFTWHEGDRI